MEPMGSCTLLSILITTSSMPEIHNTKDTHNTPESVLSSISVILLLGSAACTTASKSRIIIIQRAAITKSCNHTPLKPRAVQVNKAATAAASSISGHNTRLPMWLKAAHFEGFCARRPIR